MRTERLVETMGRNVERVRAMAPARCATLIVRAAVSRKREQVLTLEGTLLRRLYELAPGLLDRPLARLGRLYEPEP